MWDSKLEMLFNPSSVAVIGASEKPGTVGRAIMQNLLTRFRGDIYPVNIKYDKVFGIKCFKSVLEIKERIDLAVIAVPARFTLGIARECGEKHVSAAIVISAGFKETGEEGAKLEEELVTIARRYGVRVLGPNCLGVYDAHTGLDTIFNPNDRQAKPGPGNVAFISQSGALGAAILDWLTEAGVGMSKFISYGNAADIKEWELIEYLADDNKTKVIIAYIEGVEEGIKFIRAIKKSVVRRKPVVILKAGKSSRGLRAVASHTGSLAGRYEVYESALKQFGALVVKELNELIVAAKALSWLPVPKGERIAIVTNGGGAGVLATDATELSGLILAELSAETKSKLRDKLPSAASVENPVDVLGDAPPERYEVAIQEVLSDRNVDAVLVIGIMQSPAFDPAGVLQVLKNCVSKYNKPIVVAAPGGEYTADKLRRIEQEVRIPTFKTPEEAISALRYVMCWSRVLRRLGVSANKS